MSKDSNTLHCVLDLRSSKADYPGTRKRAESLGMGPETARTVATAGLWSLSLKGDRSGMRKHTPYLCNSLYISIHGTVSVWKQLGCMHLCLPFCP